MTDVSTALVVDGTPIERRAPGHFTLLRWLREAAGVFEVKNGCNEGACGSCTVLIDGTSATSCTILAASVDGSVVTTGPGLADSAGLSPLQQAFVRHGAPQCGFCTGGMLVSAHEALEAGSIASRTDVRHALHGNLCRCTGYESIVDAVMSVVTGDEQ